MSARNDSGYTEPDRLARELLTELATALQPCLEGIALIGGLAVNVHREPRFTDDIDFMAYPAVLEAVTSQLEEAGFEQVSAQGAEQSSGPDLVRFKRPGIPVVVEFLTSKTELQDSVIARAKRADEIVPIPIATPEDLIVLKLVANRSQDHRDLLELGKIEGLDWAYVEHWAPIWGIEERLANLRGWLEEDRQIAKDLGL